MYVPVSTYRLQFSPDFGFAAARAKLSYLNRLGIGGLYLAPAFAAKPGSTHGYDLVSMRDINAELGGESAYEELAHAANQHGMLLIQDIVPNHRAFYGTNKMLMDVLEHGPEAKYYGYYDIAWNHSYDNIRGRLLAPFLGDFYGRCLERGEIRFSFSEEGFKINYYELSVPVRISSYRLILDHNIERLHGALASDPIQFARFKAVVTFIGHLDQERKAASDFDYSAFIKELLWELYNTSPPVRAHINQNIEEFNSEHKSSLQFDLIDSIMSEQFFRLSYWKVGTEELNYRRFFSINDLIALRVEQEEVFLDTHELIFQLSQRGIIHGVRVDHVDGLYNPAEYLDRLRARMPESYIVVEKIIEPGEEVPDWPIQGTTGYEFMDAVGSVLCNGAASREMEDIYRGFSGIAIPYEAMVRDNKRNIIGKHMAGDIDNLALMLKGITNRNRIGNDLTMYAVRRALVEILTHFPVYRTYFSPESHTLRDRTLVEQAVQRAQETLPLMKFELELIGQFLLGLFDDSLPESDRGEWASFLMRLQQYTGPLMAKGVEDTAFYVYNRLIGRNEVGSSPTVMGTTVEEFHAFNAARHAVWSHAMNSTMTHDTKRGEDARARLIAIADHPHQWREHLLTWKLINEKHKTQIGGRDCPTRNDECHLYQAILGSAPFAGFGHEEFVPRLKAYMVKAVRESKMESSWLTPNLPYEDAVTRFIDAILDSGNQEFLASFLPCLRAVSLAGVFNSLSQTVLKCTCPGMPDVYQGSELWNLSFVDPDNRRPVDFGLLEQLVQEIETGAAENPAAYFKQLLLHPEDGIVKMYVLHRCLRLRSLHTELFMRGSYRPVEITGALREHVMAFTRSYEDECVLVIAARLLGQLRTEDHALIDPEMWKDTAIDPAGCLGHEMRNIFTGAVIDPSSGMLATELLASAPVAVYMSPVRDAR